MRAVWYEEKGLPADVLTFGEMPDPEPDAGEVRVRVVMSGINPTDSKRRSNGRELTLFPRIVPHQDGAGIIDKVGPGVDESRIGQRVWIFGAQARRPFGTAADYTCLPSDYAIDLPAAARMEDGACLGVPAVTAHRCLFADGPIGGKTVLITGATGRVGRYAVQLAKWAGARVIATGSSPAKRDLAVALGADHAVASGETMLAAVKEVAPDGIDHVVDVAFGNNIDAVTELLRKGGVVATFASDAMPRPEIPFHLLMYKNANIRMVAIFDMREEFKQQAFADINRCLAEGRLSAHIDRRYPLEQTIQAHEALEAGEVQGSLLIDVAKA
ncbi:MAG: NADPH:quinone reductase [Alphaproteobacteria bacterium]|nr:NADPH:quinone reductase [Alphaproteobacteria bacterium]MBU0796098.1 NADPH:quinone reductase [Alphaproteobacteria bacterium]MBU0888469.1 NADPH:quinone reductase [Alphaproteobacteria bacterium]MBU1813068.1 NADPH:quinone reductase [Alphaproteobacteria bacterium]